MGTLSRARRLYPLVLLALGLGVSATDATAQPARKASFSYVVEPALARKDAALPKVLYFRPNTDHGLVLHLQNNDVDALQEATVKFLRVDGKKEVVLGEAKVDKLAVGEKVALNFAKAAAGKEEKEAGAGKGKDKDDAGKGKPPAGLEWSGPRQEFLVRLEENNRDPLTKNLSIWISQPERYIDVQEAYDKKTKQLSFDVKMNKDIVNYEACKVELVLDPLLSAPFIKEGQQMVPRVTLKSPKDEFQLSVEIPELAPNDPRLKSARIFLKVDKLERSMEFALTPNQGVGVKRVDYQNKAGVRWRAPRFSLPLDKLNLTLEVDGPIDGNAWVEYAWNGTALRQANRFQFEHLHGLRNLQMGMKIKDGKLLFETQASDWTIELDTANVQGLSWLRVGASVENASGEKARMPIDKDAVAIFQQPHADSLSALEVQLKDYVDGPVIFDATPPKNIEFVDLPEDRKWLVKTPLTLRARAAQRDEQKQAKIAEAQFFYGVMQKGKVPADAVPGKLDKDGYWTAQLPKVDKAGPVEVSVRMVTQTGKDAAINESIEMVESTGDKPAVDGKKLSKIKGTVTFANRPQPDLKVSLYPYDDKKKEYGEEKTVKTNDKGEFVFTDVEPGSYVVASRLAPRAGQAPVKVPPGGKTIDKVEIILRLTK